MGTKKSDCVAMFPESIEKVQKSMPKDCEIDKVVSFFKVLADDTRIRILYNPLFCQIFRNLKKRFPLLYDKYSLAGYLRVLILWLICKNSTANSAHPHKEQDKKKYYKDIH